MHSQHLNDAAASSRAASQTVDLPVIPPIMTQTSSPLRVRSSSSPMAVDHRESSGSPSPSASTKHLHAQFLRYRRHQSTPSPFSVKLHNSPVSGAASDSDGGGSGGIPRDRTIIVGADECQSETFPGDISTCVNGGSDLVDAGSDLNNCLQLTLAAGDLRGKDGLLKTTAASTTMKSETDIDAKNRDGKKSV